MMQVHATFSSTRITSKYGLTRALIGTQMLRLGLNEVRQNSSGGGRMDGRKGSLDLEKVRPITILREQ